MKKVLTLTYGLGIIGEPRRGASRRKPQHMPRSWLSSQGDDGITYEHTGQSASRLEPRCIF